MTLKQNGEVLKSLNQAGIVLTDFVEVLESLKQVWKSVNRCKNVEYSKFCREGVKEVLKSL